MYFGRPLSDQHEDGGDALPADCVVEIEDAAAIEEQLGGLQAEARQLREQIVAFENYVRDVQQRYELSIDSAQQVAVNVVRRGGGVLASAVQVYRAIESSNFSVAPWIRERRVALQRRDRPRPMNLLSDNTTVEEAGDLGDSFNRLNIVHFYKAMFEQCLLIGL